MCRPASDPASSLHQGSGQAGTSPCSRLLCTAYLSGEMVPGKENCQAKTENTDVTLLYLAVILFVSIYFKADLQTKAHKYALP